MFKKLVYSCLVGSTMLLSGCMLSTPAQPQAVTEAAATRPDNKVEISKVSTDLQLNSGWWIIPEAADSITIFVEANHADSVLFWLAPTGTETWKERQLIGYDVDGSDGWSLTYELKEADLHHHIYVQALGVDESSIAGETINVTTE